MTATSGDTDVSRAAARRSLLNVLLELDHLPPVDELRAGDDTYLPLDDALDP